MCCPVNMDVTAGLSDGLGLPFLVTSLCEQVTTPAAAGTLLSMFDARVNDDTPPHPVSALFCDRSVDGNFRQDLENWRDGGCPSVRLVAELEAYRWCCIDDTMSESPHRDVKHAATRAPASSPAFIAGSIRQADNVQELLQVPPQRREHFWQEWRSVTALPGVAAPMTREAAVQFVYRLGDWSFRDWSVLASAVSNVCATRLPKVGQTARRNVVDAVLVPGQVHVYSSAVAFAPTAPGQPGREHAADVGAGAQFVLVQPLAVDLLNKKFMVTSSTASWSLMEAPVLVQFWAARAESDGGSDGGGALVS